MCHDIWTHRHISLQFFVPWSATTSESWGRWPVQLLKTHHRCVMRPPSTVRSRTVAPCIHFVCETPAFFDTTHIYYNASEISGDTYRWIHPYTQNKQNINVHAYTHTHIHTHIRTHIHIIRTHIHSYIHTYTHTYIHTHIHTYICSYMHTSSMHIHIHSCMSQHMHVCICVCIHLLPFLHARIPS